LTPSEIPRTRLQQASRRRAGTGTRQGNKRLLPSGRAKECQESPIVAEELDIFEMFCVFRNSFGTIAYMGLRHLR
jgi:hypothetical protein